VDEATITIAAMEGAATDVAEASREFEVPHQTDV
jgi:hypothetical protein